MKTTARTLPPGHRVLAALLLAHLCAVLALAASPRLHQWLHGDADRDDHDCAVVLFLHGGTDEAVGPLPTPGFVLEAVNFVPQAVPAAGRFVPSVFATGAVFEHGPPVAV